MITNKWVGDLNSKVYKGRSFQQPVDKRMGVIMESGLCVSEYFLDCLRTLQKGWLMSNEWKRFFIRKDRLPAQRRQKAGSLIEMMVAILCLELLLGGIVDSLMLCKRQGTSVQNNLIAASICQELMDAARDQTYATLANAAGNTVTLSGAQINSGTSGLLTGGIPYLPRPLVVDAGNNDYSSQTWDSDTGVGRNTFQGEVVQTITDLNTTPPTLSIVVTVRWPSEASGSDRSKWHNVTQSTIVSQAGIHN
jgi:type II secretory pathway pseudopilin PulG